MTTTASWRAQVRRALSFLAPFRVASLSILGLALLGAALGAIEPIALMRLIDNLAAPTGMRGLLSWLLALLGIGLARELVGSLSNWLGWRVRLSVHYGLLEATVARLHALPVAYHRSEKVGAMLTRLDRGISGFVGALSEIVTSVLPSLAYLTIACVVMVRLDWRLSLVVLAFTPLPALIGAFAAREQAEREHLLLARWAEIYSRFNEVLSGIVTVKSYTMEEDEKQRFLNGVSAANAAVIRGVGFDSGWNAARNTAALLARIAALALGGWLAWQGQVTVGTLVAFLSYIGGLFGPVQGLTNVYQTMRRASVSLETVFSILDAEDSVGDAPDALRLAGLHGDVRFESVTFSYGEGNPVLRGIDLHVRPGEVVALVGPSGGGKSTMMSLLQRLYDPTTGIVRVDGHDVRTVQQRSLRANIGVVLQDALLFNDTAFWCSGTATSRSRERMASSSGRAATTRGWSSGRRGGSCSLHDRPRSPVACD